MIAIIDYRTKEDIRKNLQKSGFTIIEAEKASEADERIAGHPDITIFQAGPHELVVSPKHYSFYKGIFETEDIEIVKGFSVPGRNYPEDIPYNAFISGMYCFHAERYTDKSVREYIYSKGIVPVNVSQGYSKCSTVVLGQSGIITSDRSIYHQAVSYKITALEVTPGYVELSGYEYGFLGGASGVFNRTVYFTGDIKEHPDYKSIRKFIEELNYEIICLSEDKLYDYGTIIFCGKERK